MAPHGRRPWFAMAVATIGLVGGGLFATYLVSRDSPAAGQASPTTHPTSGEAASNSAAPTAASEPSPTFSPTSTASPFVTAGWDVGIGVDSWVIDMAETEDLVVAVGQDGDRPSILTSADGVDWSAIDLESLGLGSAIVYTVTAGQPGLVATGGRNIADPAGSGYSSLEPFILFSADGTIWEEIDVPGPCAFVSDIVSGRFGFVILGERCRGEGDFDPRPLSILHSPDGRNWTAITDIEAFSGDDAPSMLATNGSRIAGTSDGHSTWTSDDAGATWTRRAGPFSERSGGARSIAFGHGRFLVLGDRVDEAGIVVTPVTCASTDAVAWECREQSWTADLGGQLGFYEPGVTETGFMILITQFPDEFTSGPSETVVITSRDGLAWEGAIEPALHNLFVDSVQATSHGIFMLGSTNPYRPEDSSELRIAVHRAPLP
jgi:hypothetical protein